MISYIEISEVPSRVLANLLPEVERDLKNGFQVQPILRGQIDKQWALLDDGEPVAAAGVIRQSLLGLPEFWTLTTTLVKPRHFRVYRQLVQVDLLNLFPRIRAAVATDWRRGQKFAEHFGFVPLGTTEIRAGREYNLYEAKR